MQLKEIRVVLLLLLLWVPSSLLVTKVATSALRDRLRKRLRRRTLCRDLPRVPWLNWTTACDTDCNGRAYPSYLLPNLSTLRRSAQWESGQHRDLQWFGNQWPLALRTGAAFIHFHGLVDDLSEGRCLLRCELRPGRRDCWNWCC